jgi:dUTP pyrophosphatase
MSEPLAVALRRLPHGEGLPLPAYQTAGAAGLDLLAAIAPGSGVTLAPGRRLLVPTGLALEIPPNYEAQIRPRSGLARHAGVTVLNAPGTIDSDYRGELCVLLINLGDAPYEIIRGARIAQLVVAPVARAAFFEARELSATARGDGGFGSTGHMATEEDQR